MVLMMEALVEGVNSRGRSKAEYITYLKNSIKPQCACAVEEIDHKDEWKREPYICCKPIAMILLFSPDKKLKNFKVFLYSFNKSVFHIYLSCRKQ